MLRDLRITNFAIIDELQLSLAPGLNVLTGETGAGKSIIMRAIGLLCGDRGAVDLIRSDAEEAEIEGLFDLDAQDAPLLDACGLKAADELLVRRVINRSGKSRVHINGSLATAAVLSQLGSRLIHVYGQHEHALLLKPESHLELLDDFGNLGAERERMATAYTACREAADRLASVVAGTEALRQRLELLRFQAKELQDAHPVRGEEEQLQQERERQRQAEKLGLICRQSEAALYSNDDAIVAAIVRVAAQLHEAERIDPAFRVSGEALQQAAAQIEEIANDLRRTMDHIHPDPERLEQIEERLALLGRLKRKYDCEVDELVVRLGAMEHELAQLESAGADTVALRQEVHAYATQAWTAARELSTARHAAAGRLEKSMRDELRALGLRGGLFRAVFAMSAADGPQPGQHRSEATDPATAGLSALGADMVAFYLSANPGEDPKPLARIASGGELSRIMLALKTLTAAAGEVPTLIFDEVDAGIGGTVADAVGKRLRVLGQSRQLLCITHLPQIAVQADHHFAVEKHVASGRTTTTARPLAGDQRVSEVARMLGNTGAPESQRYARRLIEGAEKAARG